MKRIYNRKHLTVLLATGLYSRVKRAGLHQSNIEGELISFSEMIRRSLEKSFPKGGEEMFSFSLKGPATVLLRKHISLILPMELYNRVRKAALCQSSREGEIVSVSEMVRRSLEECFPGEQANIFDLPVRRGNRCSYASPARS